MKDYSKHIRESNRRNGIVKGKRRKPPSWAELRCCLLGALGQSTRLISAETGLKEHQVYKVLHVNGIRRKDYRDGHNVWAQVMIAKTEQVQQRQLTQGVVNYEQMEARMRDELANMRALHLPNKAVRLLHA